jgi:hypothetical protein
VQPEQNTKLYRSYANDPGIAVSRPHGKSAQQAALFTRSPKLKEESSLLASLSRGEPLCQAFEVYRDLVADPRISFENLVFLIRALAEGHELTLANCGACGALTVSDRITFKAHHCPYCAGRGD